VPDLADMLAKARRAVLRRGVPEQDADELVQEAFLRIERYERAQRARSREALLVTAAVNLSIDRHRRDARAPFPPPMTSSTSPTAPRIPRKSSSNKPVWTMPAPVWSCFPNAPVEFFCGGV
jgi:DNA-directed RNA polymerase specialized sigma24 family protein